MISLLISPLGIPAARAQELPAEITIVVVDGEGAINNIRQRASRDLVIRVEDDKRQPVPKAAVVFALPTEGATGTFVNGSKTLTVTTDAGGEAKAEGMRASSVAGAVPIRVSASFRGLTARTTITQFNVAPAGASSGGGGGGHGKLIAILAVVGAGAAGGAVYATRKGSSSSSTAGTPPPAITPIGITPGSGTIAPPH